MPSKQPIEAKEAKQGQRMIELKVRFWTNGIADGKGKVIPKEGWTSGVVRMTPNDSHSIKASRPIPFDSLMQLTTVIERMLVREGITLHADKRTRKYVKS
jgi:hypothetical protein